MAQRRTFDLKACLLAGVLAGVVATLIQMLLWQGAGYRSFEMLLRDARLTAAIVVGPSAISDTRMNGVAVILIATAIHFGLSIVYAILFCTAIGRSRRRVAIAFGAVFGAVIYAVNLYGFTYVFPWFASTRNWITFVAHLAFGVTLGSLSERPDAGANDRARQPAL